MAWTGVRRAAAAVAACLIVPVAALETASAAVTPPSLRALELPAGVMSLSAGDPLLAPILNAATTTGGGPVVHDQAGKTLPVGKTLVTWRDQSDGSTASKYVYLYRYGWQVLGTATNLRIFEHNGARHILYDRYNRVHVIYNDCTKVWYRLGVRSGTRLQWQAPVQVNDDTTPIAFTNLGTRGQTFALWHDDADNVILQCVWSSVVPLSKSVYTRRLVVDLAGNASSGQIVNTGMVGSFACIVGDSTNKLHLAIEVGNSLAYMNSVDGTNWSNYRAWSGSYRFINLVVDSKDRVHALWQAGMSSSYWQGLYMVRNAQTGAWSTPTNIVASVPGWQAKSGWDILFAYPNLLIDDMDNLHASWHGTARSHVYAEDDVFYLKNPYNAATDSWSGWTNYAVLHKRIFPGTTDGEDNHYSWVPSLAYKPGTSDLYAVFMFGTGDDEIDDPSVNLTDAGLKKFIGGTWQPSFENLTQSTDQKSWYPNVPPQVMVDANGRTWLDMIWVDGTKDDYNIIFRRIDLGGGLTGDVNGDGYVNVGDLQALVAAWGSNSGAWWNWDPRADLNQDTYVNIGDLQVLVANWGR